MKYFSPESLKEASRILRKEENSFILAGGSDLLVNLRNKKIKVETIVDIKRINGLSYIKKDKNYIRIGALTNMNEIAESKILEGPYEVLKKSASWMGCYEIRNRATIGGNIVNASPGADTVLPLVVLEAKVSIYGEKGTRTISIEKFLKGVNKVDLKRGEILKEILIPLHSKNTKGFYFRRSRTKGMDLASFNACMIRTNGRIKFAIGTVAPTPYRNKKAEEILSSSKIEKKTVEKVLEMINSEISPRKTSLRASPEYKKLMVKVFFEDGLKNLGVLK